MFPLTITQHDPATVPSAALQDAPDTTSFNDINGHTGVVKEVNHIIHDGTAFSTLASKNRADPRDKYYITKFNAKSKIPELLAAVQNRKINSCLFFLLEDQLLNIILHEVNPHDNNSVLFCCDHIFSDHGNISTAGLLYFNNNNLIFSNFPEKFSPNAETLLHIDCFLQNAGIDQTRFTITNYTHLGCHLKKETRLLDKLFACGSG